MKKIVCLLLVLVFAFALTGCGPEIADEKKRVHPQKLLGKTKLTPAKPPGI